MSRDHWIFGYGSLVWRPAFEHIERAPGYVTGFVRRFWQASADHRGTPEAPGRVVTLHREPSSVCWGMGYRVEAARLSEVLETLDYRERAGYERVYTDLYLRGARSCVRALVYIATPDNPNYLGPAPQAHIAEVISRCHGPSGSNREYLLRLAEALAQLGVDDPHVSELAAMVRVQSKV